MLQAFQEKIEKQVNGPGSGVSGLHKRGCHCKKSHCKKKYCECFQVNLSTFIMHWLLSVHALFDR